MLGVTVITTPPDTKDAQVNIYTQHSTMYTSRDHFQASPSEIEFSYHGFHLVGDIERFEYKIDGIDGPDWINIETKVILFVRNSYMQLRLVMVHS